MKRGWGSWAELGEVESGKTGGSERGRLSDQEDPAGASLQGHDPAQSL